MMDYRRLAVDELRHINELRAAERICRDRLAELTEELHGMKIPSPQTDPVQAEAIKPRSAGCPSSPPRWTRSGG